MQESFHVRPRLHRVHQVRQLGVILQPFSPLLRQTLVVADLIEHHIRICDILPSDVRPRCRQLMCFQMRLQSVQEPRSNRPLMLRISFFLVVCEEGLDEERAP